MTAPQTNVSALRDSRRMIRKHTFSLEFFLIGMTYKWRHDSSIMPKNFIYHNSTKYGKKNLETAFRFQETQSLWFDLKNSYGKNSLVFGWPNFGLISHVVVVVVSLLIQLNPRAQNVFGPWREPHRRYKSELRPTKHDSPHRTIETPRTPRSQGGGRYECRFHAGRGKTTRASPSRLVV